MFLINTMECVNNRFRLKMVRIPKA